MTKVNVLRVSFEEKHVQSSCCRQNKAWQVGRYIKRLVRSECKESERENVQRNLEEVGGARICMALQILWRNLFLS